MTSELTGAAWTAALVVWACVNAIDVMQTVGYLTRKGADRRVNHALGYVMMALSLPLAWALVVFVREDAGWLFALGPALWMCFSALLLAVDYVWPVEFRRPWRAAVAVPYVTLFFASIFFMGVPMFRLDRGLWYVTAVTAGALVVSMGVSMRRGTV